MAVRGFTLVELITVVMLLGILSLGTVRFISDASNGYASTMARTALAEQARFVVNRISRELRDVLPNSVRISAGCLEFLPVRSASTYLTLPVATAATSFESVPIDPSPGTPARVAVFPQPNLYALNNPGSISDTATLSAPDAQNKITVSFAAHRFSSESADNRFYLVGDPVSYCDDAGRLWRYENYGFLATQPLPADLPTALPDRALVVEGVSANFAMSSATLSRNAVVELNLTFTKGTNSVVVEQLVQVRNVP